MQDEDKNALAFKLIGEWCCEKYRKLTRYLQWIEDCEYPGEDSEAVVDSQQAKEPGKTKQRKEDNGA